MYHTLMMKEYPEWLYAILSQMFFVTLPYDAFDVKHEHDHISVHIFVVS